MPIIALACVACRSERQLPIAQATTTPPAGRDDVPVIDELSYFDELVARRPELISSSCYDSLTLKPKYRQRLLAGDSVSAIRERTYTAEQRASDAQWAASLQSAELSYCSQHNNPGGCPWICKTACDVCPSSMSSTTPSDAVNVWPSGYPLCDFVGYQVGPRAEEAYDHTGKIRDWKVFFELKDEALASVDAATYLRFTRELEHAGFHGDSKIMMGSGRVRYQYNDIIVHAQTPDDARIAERIGLQVFGTALAARARGLDLASTKSSDGLLDWHHYLCAEGKAGIPPEGLAFVQSAAR